MSIPTTALLDTDGHLFISVGMLMSAFYISAYENILAYNMVFPGRQVEKHIFALRSWARKIIHCI